MGFVRIVFIPLAVFALSFDVTSGNDNRWLPRTVCQKSGCSCSPNPVNFEEVDKVEMVECSCRDSVGESTEVFKVKSKLPKNMNTFVLRKCKTVILDKDLFSDHILEALVIEDIEKLSIMEKSVKSVINLTMKNIGSISLDRNSLDRLRADKIVLDNVIVAPPSIQGQIHSEIHPETVISQFVINNSYLPSGVSLKIKPDRDDGDLLVSFKNCHLGRPDAFEIKSSRFEMIGNKFSGTWSENRAAIVKYAKQAALVSNSLKGNLLPNITIDITEAPLEIVVNPVERKTNAVTYRQWFESLGLVHKGIMSDVFQSHQCFENKANDPTERRVSCQSQNSLESFLKSERFFQLFIRDSRIGGVSGANHLSNGVSFFVVLAAISLFLSTKPAI